LRYDEKSNTISKLIIWF